MGKPWLSEIKQVNQGQKPKPKFELKQSDHRTKKLHPILPILHK